MGLLRFFFRSFIRTRRRDARRVTTTKRITTTVVTEVRRTVPPSRPAPEPTVLTGYAWVIDGDTIVIDKTHIRIAGIDAPELDHPYGQMAKWAVVKMCKGQRVVAHLDGALSHDRAVARCILPDGRDIAEELVKQGLAIDWPKYSGGKYRRFETADARKRLWRVHQRQLGRFPPQS